MYSVYGSYYYSILDSGSFCPLKSNRSFRILESWYLGKDGNSHFSHQHCYFALERKKIPKPFQSQPKVHLSATEDHSSSEDW